jgi:16S rRNA processing protein RimM
MVSDAFIVLAIVTSPHGVSGRVKIKSFGNPPTLFAETKALKDEVGNPVRITITSGENTVYIAQIDGLKSCEDAELWRNRKLGILRSELEETRKDGEFYIADLVGLPVQLENGNAFGTVKEVYNFGAGDIIEITKANGSDEMFSFNTATFPIIDVAAKRIVIAPPEIIRGEEHD